MPQTNKTTEEILWELYRTLSDLDIATTIEAINLEDYDMIRALGKANGIREASKIVLALHEKAC